MSPTQKEERLDPRIKRTRSLIQQSFRELLSEKGFQSVSVQDITEKAGINRATFYAHFPDKYALLDHSMSQGFRMELEKRSLNACQYSDENLRALIIMVCEFVSNANAHCKPSNPQFESLVETQVKNHLQRLLEMWLEQEESGIDSKTAATAASWAIYGLVLQWSHDKNKKKPSAEKFAEQVLPLIASNLRLAQPA
ncbi:MAG: TetR/AcrR family transcriptional regulator [Anaerolineae bacterium]|nr:TetR/AcrR family transcriptional regulator [Anaerolineae bacterium]